MQWLTNNLGTIAIIVSSVFTFAGVLVTVLFKNKGAGRLLKSIGNVVKRLPTLIKTAEKLGGTGEEKKLYVMEQVALYFLAEGVEPTEDDLASISEQVDAQVKLSKELHTTVQEVKTDNNQTVNNNILVGALHNEEN